MLRINSIKMSLDLTKVGFIRMGHVLCTNCSADNMNDITREMRRKEADPLYVGEAVSHRCDLCGAPLVRERVTA